MQVSPWKNWKVNFDLKNMIPSLRASKISLNTDKTKLILFWSKNKVITKHLDFCISGQKIHPLTKEKKHSQWKSDIQKAKGLI